MSALQHGVYALGLVAAFVYGVWCGIRAERGEVSYWLTRGIRESGCTPPRAGVDA